MFPILGVAVAAIGLLAWMAVADGLPSLQPKQMAIEYIAHACYRIYTQKGTVLLIDPYASRVWLGYDLPAGLADDADAVLITHPHFDHDAGEFLGRKVPWPTDKRVVRDPGPHTVGDVRIHGIPGKHAGPYGKEFGQKNTMFVLEIDGLRIAHLGDNEPLSDEKVQELGRVDVLMITIDAQEHLLKYDEVEAIRRALRPRILIPMHYRHDDLETDKDSPRDLGPIDPWLKGKKNVDRRSTNVLIVSEKTLPDEERIVVLPHSPLVRPGRK